MDKEILRFDEIALELELAAEKLSVLIQDLSEESTGESEENVTRYGLQRRIIKMLDELRSSREY